MITLETKPVKTWGGFNLTILKVNLNPLWNNRSCSTGLRPLTFYRYPPVETYWHNHVQAPRPRTPSFLDSPASTSTPTCVSLSFYCSNWMIIKFLNRILLLDNPKYVWRQIYLDLTKDSHTANRATKSLESFWVQNPRYKKRHTFSL